MLCICNMKDKTAETQTCLFYDIIANVFKYPRDRVLYMLSDNTAFVSADEGGAVALLQRNLQGEDTKAKMTKRGRGEAKTAATLLAARGGRGGRGGGRRGGGRSGGGGRGGCGRSGRGRGGGGRGDGAAATAKTTAPGNKSGAASEKVAPTPAEPAAGAGGSRNRKGKVPTERAGSRVRRPPAKLLNGG